MISTIKKLFTRKTAGKKYLLPVASHFPIWHKQADEETHFGSKIISGDKLHAIRSNYPFWDKAGQRINSGKYKLVICYMTDAGEEKKYSPITIRERMGVQHLTIHSLSEGRASVDNRPVSLHELARNEGLTYRDFCEWFRNDRYKELCIVHFTNFRY